MKTVKKEPVYDVKFYCSSKRIQFDDNSSLRFRLRIFYSITEYVKKHSTVSMALKYTKSEI